MKRSILLFITIILIINIIPFTANAEDTAADYTGTSINAVGFDYPQYLTDEKEKTYADSEGYEYATIELSNPEGISQVYVVFDKICSEWAIVEPKSGKEYIVGKNNFLHEYIDVTKLFGKELKTLVLRFKSSAYVAEVYGFTKGTLPEWVQQWETPLEKADILLLSSHSDDEQLFFAGILPYYAGERKVQVQVVYLINHFDTHDRPHEQLNGLWAVGVKNYPIISEFPDLYSESLNGAISAFEKKGFTYDDFTSYIVENIRRFKPQVLITHDIKGEYGHGTHIYCTDVVINSIEKTNDPAFCPESVEKWGVWDVSKTYLHLYGENTITMNWDVPLSAFDGKTAFEMTVEGFSHHKSQHWTWFNDWIHGKESAPITKASQIKSYSPCKYGLYRTTVGSDTVGGDFLENIIPYKDQTPPETTPPETEAETTEKTEPAITTYEEKADEKTDVTKIDHKVLLIAIIVTVIVIFAIYIVFTKNKKA